MYDIKPLEEEWERYRKKRLKPIYIFTIFVFTMFVIFFLLLNNVNFSLFNRFMYNTDKNKVVISESKTDEIIDSIITENSKVSVNEEKQKISNTNNVPVSPIVENIPILEIEKNIKTTEPTKEIPRKKIYLNIIESSSISAYKDVEKRFYQSRDTDDSLFLAKSYYRKGDYKKAEYWALQTNKINHYIDESWIIFARSKMKLGKKNEALHILENYIKRSGSDNAKHALSKLKNN